MNTGVENENNLFTPYPICVGTNDYHGQDHQETLEINNITAIVQADGTSYTRTRWSLVNNKPFPNKITDDKVPVATHSGLAARAVTDAGKNIVNAWATRRNQLLDGNLNVGVYPWYALYQNIVDFLETNPDSEYLGNSTLGIIAYDKKENKILFGGVGNQAIWLILGNGTAIKLPIDQLNVQQFKSDYITTHTECVDTSANINSARKVRLKEISLDSYVRDIKNGCAIAVVTDGFLPYNERQLVSLTEQSAVNEIAGALYDPDTAFLSAIVNDRSRQTGDDAHLGIIMIRPFTQRITVSKVLACDGKIIGRLGKRLPSFDEYLDEIAYINDVSTSRRRYKTQPAQKVPLPPMKPLPKSRYPTIIVGEHESDEMKKYELWSKGRCCISINYRSIEFETRDLIKRAYSEYKRKNPNSSVNIDNLLFQHSQKGLVVSFSGIPSGLVREILRLTLKQPYKYQTLVDIFEQTEGHTTGIVPSGEDTNKRKIGYNGIQRLSLGVSRLLEETSISNDNRALNTLLEVLNKHAFSATTVHAVQRKRLAGCCCLTKFLSLPNTKHRNTSGIIYVTKTQLVKVIENEKRKRRDVNDIIVKMINCIDFKDY